MTMSSCKNVARLAAIALASGARSPTPVRLSRPIDAVVAVGPIVTSWMAPAEAELKKIPFFVRGKVRRNTEQYAHDNGIAEITVDIMYDAKAFYGR